MTVEVDLAVAGLIRLLGQTERVLPAPFIIGTSAKTPHTTALEYVYFMRQLMGDGGKVVP